MSLSESYQLVVIGGGPAGLAAAAEAASAGVEVALVDERPTLGGQIYKQFGHGFAVPEPRRLGADYLRGRALIDDAEGSGAVLLTRTSALSIEGTTVIVAREGEPARALTAQGLVLAPGAHDRPVVFPGWTLPGVLTAGAAQALVKTQRIVPGRKLVFAGSGPLALAFPAQLHHYGATVAAAFEAGPAPRPGDLLRLAAAARGNAGLLRDAASYRLELLRARVPLRYRRLVVRAEGRDRVEAVVHAAVDADWRVLPGTEERIEADTLCVGYGFFPSVELPLLAGCECSYDEDLGGPTVLLDEWMRTSVLGIFAAGDGTGVAGSFVAVDEGRLAALGAAVELGAMTQSEADRRALPIRARLAQKGRFRKALHRMHRIGAGIYELADGATTVCRCEEVSGEELEHAVSSTGDVNVVKALTRAGMGLCQGRSCQRQILAMIAARQGVALGGLSFATPRAPVRPVALSALADESVEGRSFFTR